MTTTNLTLEAEQPLPRRWPDIIAAAALLALVVAFFWKMVFTNLILPRGDVFAYFYPYWHYRHLIMRTGQIPLWNPYIFMGAPFLANSQTGVLYPPNWLLTALEAPDAIKAAIVMASGWAALGTYVFARRSLKLSILASVMAGVIFALGGYFSAQVEHINQVQGLSWLPWLFWLWAEALDGHPKALLGMALAFGFQLLAGHTQSTFITGVGLGVWALWRTFTLWREGRKQADRKPSWLTLSAPLGIIGIAALLALGLAAAQILPTLELTQLSNRGGGLTAIEAVSFSLHPAIVGRALLPVYADETLFSEYVAYTGIAVLLIALPAFWRKRRDWRVLGLGLLAALGLFFALGAYNPVYWGLVRFVPGFDLFRAPARWLILYAFSLSVLAGVGLDALTERQRGIRQWWPALVILILGGWAFLAPLEGDPITNATRPGIVEIVIWAATVLLAAVALNLPSQARRYAPALLSFLITLELFGAAEALPYNHLSAPEIWAGQRPAISTLLAAKAGQNPPARVLSMSDTVFDPGDMAELEAAYAPYLDQDAFDALITATKQKEILAPNLPMAWGIPSMDGFGGGVLPTRAYTQFTSLFLPPDTFSPDGRLREYLDEVPALDWLRIANVGWIITDKVADAWINGIYYDLQFPAQLSPSDEPSAPIEAYPQLPFTATAVGIIGSVDGADGLPDGTQIGSVAVYTEDDDLPLVQPLLTRRDLTGESTRICWPEPFDVEHVEISLVSGFPGTLTVQGVTLIDERSGAFMAMTISPDEALRYIYSAEVKIYEHAGTLPRAYLACAPATVPTQEDALASLAANPSQPVIVLDGPAPGIPVSCDAANPGTATITAYQPESVEITVGADGDGSYLILSDAWYPGWSATLDGQPVEILQANGLFRAVPVPAGQHDVVFTYESRPFITGTTVSLITLVGVLVALGVRWRAGTASGLREKR